MDQAADHADVLGQAQRQRTDQQHLPSNSSRRYLEPAGSAASARSPPSTPHPQPERAGHQAKRVEHVHGQRAAVAGGRTGHVEGRDAAVFGRGRLDRVDRLFAGRKIRPLGHVAGGINARPVGLQVVVDQDPRLGRDAAALQNSDIRRTPRSRRSPNPHPAPRRPSRSSRKAVSPP